MPRPKPWIPRIGQIISYLEQTDVTRLSRAQVEKLFELGRSAATEIMNAAGYTTPGSGFVSRDALLFYVRNSREGRLATEELERRKKLAKELQDRAQELKLRKVELPVSRLDEWVRLRDLNNITIRDGVMRVAFSSPHDLMGQLYRFAKAASNEWDQFEKLCANETPDSKTKKAV